MGNKKLVLVGIGTLAGLATSVVCEIKKRERLNRIEGAISGLIINQESMLRYQNAKNEDFDDRLESLVDEVASVYEHMEELSNFNKESE